MKDEARKWAEAELMNNPEEFQSPKVLDELRRQGSSTADTIQAALWIKDLLRELKEVEADLEVLRGRLAGRLILDRSTVGLHMDGKHQYQYRVGWVESPTWIASGPDATEVVNRAFQARLDEWLKGEREEP